MNHLTVSCPHCSKPSRLDADSLPNQPAFFPCPHCNGRVVVDKSKELPAQQAASPPPVSPSAPAEQAPPAPTEQTLPAPTEQTLPAPTEQTLPASAEQTLPAPAEQTAPAVEPRIPDRRFTALPADAMLPSGIIVGQDQSATEGIRELLAALGSEVEQVSSPEAARQMIIDECPELCIFVAEGNVVVPHEPMAALTRLRPSIRRGLYLVLIADGVKSGDGTAAFMHEVNLVLAKQDLSQLGAALHCGLEYHRRLYRPYVEAIETKGTI